MGQGQADYYHWAWIDFPRVIEDESSRIITESLSHRKGIKLKGDALLSDNMEYSGYLDIQ